MAQLLGNVEGDLGGTHHKIGIGSPCKAEENLVEMGQ